MLKEREKWCLIRDIDEPNNMTAFMPCSKAFQKVSKAKFRWQIEQVDHVTRELTVIAKYDEPIKNNNEIS